MSDVVVTTTIRCTGIDVQTNQSTGHYFFLKLSSSAIIHFVDHEVCHGTRNVTPPKGYKIRNQQSMK